MFDLMINGLVSWMLNGAVEAWKQACKMALLTGTLTDNQWLVAEEVVSKLAGVMLFVDIITGAVAIVRKVLAKNLGGIILVSGQVVLSWPLTLILLYIVLEINTMATHLTSKILGIDFSKPEQNIKIPDIVTAPVKNAFAPPLLLLFALLIIVSAAMIILCMAGRSYLLIIAVSFICMAWMLIPSGKALQQSKRYFDWVLGIILYQPICAILIYTTGQLMEKSGNDNPIAFILAIVGMCAASICPWIIIRKLIHILPVSKGISDTATISRNTMSSTANIAKKTAGAFSQAAGIAAGVAPTGRTGGANISPTSNKSTSTPYTPKVDPGQPSNTSESSGSNASYSASNKPQSVPTQAAESSSQSTKDRAFKAAVAGVSTIPLSNASRAVMHTLRKWIEEDNNTSDNQSNHGVSKHGASTDPKSTDTPRPKVSEPVKPGSQKSSKTDQHQNSKQPPKINVNKKN